MRKILLSLGLFLLMTAGAISLVAGSFYLLLGERPLSSGDIAVFKIEGPLYSADSIIQRLNEIRKDKSFKGVLIRDNSPGGTVAASQEIHDAILRLKKDGKKVVVSMETVAASGGYYLAVPADWIVANPGTITGSIGVRLEYMNVEELLAWAKLKRETLKAGKFKDVASPIRPMTDEEKAYLEALLAEMHSQFKEAIQNGRKMSADEVEAIADGRIFSGREALQLKLVDELGSYDVALDKLTALAGIKGEPKVVDVPAEDESVLDSLLGAKASALLQLFTGASKTEMMLSDKLVPLYLW